MQPVSKQENLKREIGVRSLALAIVNITAGSGIFVLPAIIAQDLGAASILAYLVCGGLIFLIGLCFAELGAKTSVSGGVYNYIETAFGPFAGFLANNIYWLGGCIVSDAAIANALVDTLKYSFPVLGTELYRAIFLIIVFGCITLLNIRSVKNGVRLIEFATLGKLIPLIAVVVAGAAFVSPENLRWTIQPTVSNLGAASLLLFFAFIGLDGPLSNGGEIKNPKHTVPLGVFFGIGIVLLLYLSIQLVTQAVLGANISAHKDAPLAAVADIALGKAGAIIIIAAAALSMLGALGGEILSIPRILFAGARDGLMPKPLAKVHSRYFTPYVAIICYASLGLTLAISGGFKQLATIASAALLIIYLGVVMATVKLRKQPATTGEKTFRVFGGIIVPVAAAAGIIWLLSNLSKTELTGIVLFILLFSFAYFVMKQLKANSMKKSIE